MRYYVYIGGTTMMELKETESKDGLYDIYADGGTTYIVLPGLRIEDRSERPALQNYIHSHYSSVEAIYWFLFFATLLFVLWKHIFQPLLTRSSRT